MFIIDFIRLLIMSCFNKLYIIYYKENVEGAWVERKRYYTNFIEFYTSYLKIRENKNYKDICIIFR